MAKRNVVDFKIINLSEEKFQELKEAGQIDPNALYTTPDTTKERLDALEINKQDKLTAGSGITISENVISATGLEVPIDAELSNTSVNPVQNKVITAGLSELESRTETLVDSVNTLESNVVSLDSITSALQTSITALQDTKQDKGDYATSEQVSTKQDITTAVNYDNITNCITHIPQDIKLELNNGTLTLKAGSKYYYPDGTNTFNDNTTTTELTLGPVGTYTGQSMVYLVVDGSALTQALENISGTTAPTRGAWYDTNTNYIKYYSDGSDTGIRYSFPIALATRTNGEWTSIDQVFNGFGYIGSTAFALPDIKWLSPDGRNADGTLKSTEHTNTSVLHMYYPYDDNIVLYMGENLLATSGSYVQSETEPTTEYTVWYKPSENILRFKMVDSWVIIKDRIVFGRVRTSTTGIKSFSTISAFHAVDYNDTEFIAHQAMPSNKADFLTIGASGATYTAPADGYFIIRATANVAGGYAVISNESIQLATNPVAINAGGGVQSFLPVKTGDVVYVWYKDITINHFRFIYAEGAK